MVGVYWGRSPVTKIIMKGAPFTQKGEGKKEKRKKRRELGKGTGVVENPNTRVR